MGGGFRNELGVETTSGHRIGRPDAGASLQLDRHILATAERLFIEQGYAATSMEQIATAAGSGKQTIYRRYASKEDLFKAVTATMTTKLVDMMVSAEAAPASPMAALRQACVALLDFVCRPEVISIYRVLIGESERFPGVAATTLRDSGEKNEKLLQDLLEAAQRSGEIEVEAEPQVLLHVLTALMTGWAIGQNLLGANRLTDPAERAAYFDLAWTVFLNGVARK